MRSIVLNARSRRVLIGQLAERRAGLPVPMRWHEMLNELSREETGVGAAEYGWEHVLSGQACLFAWEFCYMTIATALSRRCLVYLCWGVPKRRAWKNWIVAMVLRRAEWLLVNDIKTQREIEVISGRRAEVVPYFIDTEFFSFSPLSERSDFLFCNGVNDRDPELLLAFAERGYTVIWLVNDSALSRRYKGRHPNLVLRSSVSYEELRELYQTCAVNIMPTLNDAHCAGQTTGMEAIACGAPLLISKGRTASLLSDLLAVRAVEKNTIEAWTVRLAEMSLDDDLASKTAQARERLADRVSRKRLKRILATILHSKGANKHLSMG